jgi:hypothetical protein
MKNIVAIVDVWLNNSSELNSNNYALNAYDCSYNKPFESDEDVIIYEY